MTGHYKGNTGSILNAYREGDMTFNDAVKEIEEAKLKDHFCFSEEDYKEIKELLLIAKNLAPRDSDLYERLAKFTI